MSKSERDPNELSHLYLNQVLPLDPSELARTTPSNELHGRAVGEHSIAEGLRVRAEALRAELSLVESQIEDAEIRKATFIEAHRLAKSEEHGE